MKTNKKGFGVIEGLLIVAVIALLGFVGYKAYQNHTADDTDTSQQVTNRTAKAKETATSTKATSSIPNGWEIHSIEPAAIEFYLPAGYKQKSIDESKADNPDVPGSSVDAYFTKPGSEEISFRLETPGTIPQGDFDLLGAKGFSGSKYSTLFLQQSSEPNSFNATTRKITANTALGYFDYDPKIVSKDSFFADRRSTRVVVGEFNISNAKTKYKGGGVEISDKIGSNDPVETIKYILESIKSS